MMTPARSALATAMREVPRMYPPTWSSARSPPLIRASRRHPSVEASTQSQALSPSISRKKVRNPPRMAIVTMFAAAATKSLSPPRTRPRIASEIRCMIPVSSDGTPSAVSWVRAAVDPGIERGDDRTQRRDHRDDDRRDDGAEDEERREHDHAGCLGGDPSLVHAARSRTVPASRQGSAQDDRCSDRRELPGDPEQDHAQARA